MMPWDSVGQKFLSSILGVTGVTLIVFAIFLVGVGIMYTKADNHKLNCIRVAIGASIAGAATTIGSFFV